ncbi:MAG: BamA/TamA family outer membrane protein [candidate division KSB1 bacterium]|nr:BamA/TamA family outer membrane protein [candidate division KSB1 bacterium]MDZ7334788.1 BamA/TamA family outer membrane protein [candidate division KSB1 bacterium]MDZ7358121.1 BamA/TamA family outer membrane protein [candidate division KSB1 bacterium]
MKQILFSKRLAKLLIEGWIAFAILGKTISIFAQQDTSRILIPKWKIEGGHKISREEIEKILPAGRYTAEQIESGINLILKRYQDRGYWFSRIDIEEHRDEFTMHISEGLPLKIGSIKFDYGDSIIVRELASRIDIREKKSASETIEFNIDQVLTYLGNNGYPFGQIAVDSLIIRQDSEGKTVLLDCYFTVKPGPKVTIDSIGVQGNTTTRRAVVIREMRLKRGESYQQNRIDRSRLRLVRSGLFQQVDEPEIYLDQQGHGLLMVRVSEGNPNQLNAVLGYNPAVTNREKGYFTGLIDVAFRNLLGTGRSVEAYWQKKDRRSQELRFHYLEPWVAGYPLNMGAGFQQLIQDTTFIRRQILLEIEFPYSDVLSFSSYLGSEVVLPDSMGQILYQLPQSNSWFSRWGLSYDTRNDPLNPSRGVLYQTQFEYARKTVSAAPSAVDRLVNQGKFRRERWLVDFELFVPTFRWQTFMLGLHGRQVKSNESYVSISDLFRLGGTRSLRGYREEQFWGEKIAWLNLEYRYLLTPRSRAFAFIDAGYFYHKDRSQNLNEGSKYGYGFGLRIETRLGIIGIDYGLATGRSLSSGLVHVGLTNKF